MLQPCVFRHAFYCHRKGYCRISHWFSTVITVQDRAHRSAPTSAPCCLLTFQPHHAAGSVGAIPTYRTVLEHPDG